MTNVTQPTLNRRLSSAYTPKSATYDQPPIGKQVAQGKTPATPFLLLGSVALFVFAAVAVVTVAALLVWWLV